ncbi:hypothetical protein CEXT_479291 [Caerostris extrusa]|uniref:Uncharacterized protein n=1 Tax=Caerostris extrusa TaxID=172846 RepID=A0AAV4U0N2_CAEEX|nr:hypothetical protein CEXT_479291 [Caerostris extrusa]
MEPQMKFHFEVSKCVSIHNLKFEFSNGNPEMDDREDFPGRPLIHKRHLTELFWGCLPREGSSFRNSTREDKPQTSGETIRGPEWTQFLIIRKPESINIWYPGGGYDCTKSLLLVEQLQILDRCTVCKSSQRLSQAISVREKTEARKKMIPPVMQPEDEISTDRQEGKKKNNKALLTGQLYALIRCYPAESD